MRCEVNRISLYRHTPPPFRIDATGQAYQCLQRGHNDARWYKALRDSMPDRDFGRMSPNMAAEKKETHRRSSRRPSAKLFCESLVTCACAIACVSARATADTTRSRRKSLALR